MDYRLRFCHVVLIVAMLFSMAPTGATQRLAAAPVTAEIEPELVAQIQAEGSAGYLIYFREAPDLTPATKLDWQARGRYAVAALQETADRSQKGVRAYLEARGVPYRSFWIDNVIVVERSDLSTANTLATSFPEIAVLRARRAPILHEPVDIRPSATLTAIESNLQHVLADQVWDMGYTGQGIVVANIDSGVRYTHDALVNPYRGNLGGGSFDHNHNWWDPYLGTTAPSDSQNHGSHTMGTMVGDDGGDNRIGMAPGAQWIACKSFQGGDIDAQLLECGQFMAAPWDLTGANADPDLRPHIVNNSWGDCGQVYDDWYDGVLTAWHAAGIYPVFSNGNAGACGYSSPPGLNTVGNPARAGNVTGVGATGTSDGQYAIYSTWGPTDDPDTVNPRGYPQLKPQVVAPGTNRSAYGTGTDATYGGMSGTSMAAPHVAGLVALMWSAAPCLLGDYATTETIIEETATPIPYATGGSPAPGPDNVPNYATGWGEINALAAVEAAIVSCGGGTLMGAVTDGATLEPIAGAQVRASALLTEARSTLTDPNGLYNLAVYPGTYTVTVASYGYQVEVVPDVQVSAGLTTTLDVPLTAATWYTVSGSVTDAATGWPLYAEIDIDGYPGAPIRTDPVTGAYSISLPGGMAYTFGVTAWVAGYTAASIPVGPLTDDALVDVDLDPDRAFCRAPGYQTDDVYEEDFEASDGGYTPGGTPAGEWQWGAPTVWPSGCASGEACWGTNLTGNYSDSADTTLISPVIDLSGASAPVTARWWQALHIESAEYDHAYAEVSTNGGPWQTMWEHTGGTTQIDWTGMSYDLSAAAGGNVQFRFRLTSDSSVAYAGYYIDLATISRGADCHAPADGGLVVGNVYDVETGDPLVGARVENEAGELMLTQATPADAAVDDGFYTLFAPSGPQVFTATLAPYTPQTETVMVEEGGTVRQDFDLQWLRPRVATVPAALDVTVELGAQLTETLEILNTGAVATDFEISERDRGFQPTAGEDVLVVAYDTAAAAAMEAAMDAIRVTYVRATRDTFQATAVGDLLAYGAVLYAGSSSGDGWAKAMAYLDAGGALYISDNDLGYSPGLINAHT